MICLSVLQETAPVEQGLTLAWIDLVGLSLLAGLALLGFVRGLWWQVVRLLGLAAAVFCARGLTPTLAPRFTEWFPDMPERLAQGLVWFALFVAGLVVVSLFGLIGKKSLEVMQLGLADRLGGALAGVATAAVLHAAFLVLLLQLGPEEWTQDAMRDARSRTLLDSVARKVPLVVDAGTAERLEPWLAPRGSVLAGDGAEDQ